MSSISNSFIISNLIIKIHNEDNQNLNILKLLELLYICFGYISVDRKKYLFDDDIEAWELGPVISQIYFHVRYYVDYSNNYEIRKLNYKKDNPEIDINKEIYEDIKWICKYYYGEKYKRLIALTKAFKTPWSDIYDGTPSKIIPKENIIKYFKNTFFK